MDNITDLEESSFLREETSVKRTLQEVLKLIYVLQCNSPNTFQRSTVPIATDNRLTRPEVSVVETFFKRVFLLDRFTVLDSESLEATISEASQELEKYLFHSLELSPEGKTYNAINNSVEELQKSYQRVQDALRRKDSANSFGYMDISHD